MNTRTIYWVGAAIAVLVAVISASQTAKSIAQVVERDPTLHVEQPGQVYLDTATNDVNDARKACKASELVGMDVRGLSGDDNIGSINDLVIGHDGRIKYAAVSFGGFLGMGDKLFAVPFEALDFVKTDDDAYARIDVTEETLKEKQGFNQDKWPTEADRTFTNGNLRRQAATGGLNR